VSRKKEGAAADISLSIGAEIMKSSFNQLKKSRRRKGKGLRMERVSRSGQAYIYIYIEREREREFQCCWPNKFLGLVLVRL
jgi:hypothetical protein